MLPAIRTTNSSPCEARASYHELLIALLHLLA